MKKSDPAAAPSGDRGAIEKVTGLKFFRAEGFYWHADVLFLAARVGETKINEFDVLILDRLEYLFWSAHKFSSL
jgi:hypothetical protein